MSGSTVKDKIEVIDPDGKPIDMGELLSRMNVSGEAPRMKEPVWAMSLESVPCFGLSCGSRNTSYGKEVIVISYWHIYKLLNTILDNLTPAALAGLLNAGKEAYDSNDINTDVDKTDGPPPPSLEVNADTFENDMNETITADETPVEDGQKSPKDQRKDILNTFVNQPLMAYRPPLNATRSVCIAFSQILSRYDPRLRCPDSIGGYNYMMLLYGMPSEKTINEWCKNHQYPLWYRGWCRIEVLRKRQFYYIPLCGVPYYIIQRIIYGKPQRPLTYCELVDRQIERCINQQQTSSSSSSGNPEGP